MKRIMHLPGLFLVFVMVASLVNPALSSACKPEDMALIGTLTANISTETLLSLIKTKVEMVVVDARTDTCIDGERIPGAVYLNASSATDLIQQRIPNKEALVVIYSSDATCSPNNQFCAKHLIESGFRNLVSYNDGIDEWRKRGFQVEKDPQPPQTPKTIVGK